ncbi:TPA: hypothetical protein JLG68_001365 [Escherichia coli]|nr:hypothetical protein [Escherichia coli]
MATKQNEFNFDFDVIDKRVTQISVKDLTASDRLIYGRMFNEYRLWKDKPGGYTPTNTSLAVVGCYAKAQSVIASLKRLASLSLIEKLPTKPRQACRYIVHTIDEALKLNPGLLSQPTMSERRADKLPLESKGHRRSTPLKAHHYTSQSTSTTPLKAPGYTSQSTHEITHKEQERTFKEEGQKTESQMTSFDGSEQYKDGTEQKKDELNCDQREAHCEENIASAIVSLSGGCSVSVIGSKGYIFDDEEDPDQNTSEEDLDDDYIEDPDDSEDWRLEA